MIVSTWELRTWIRVWNNDITKITITAFDQVFSGEDARVRRRIWRRANRRCLQCGMPLGREDGQRCPAHAALAAVYAKRYKASHPEVVERHKAAYILKSKADPEHRNKVRRDYYHANAAEGRCVRCPRKALAGLKECRKHHRSTTRQNKRRRAA